MTKNVNNTEKKRNRKPMSNEVRVEKTPYKEILELLKVCWFRNGKLLGLQHCHLLYAFLDKSKWKKFLPPHIQHEVESFFEKHVKWLFVTKYCFKQGIVTSPRMLDYYLNELYKKKWITRTGTQKYYTYFLSHNYVIDLEIMRFKKNLQSWKVDEIYNQSYLLDYTKTTSRVDYPIPSFLLCGLQQSQFTDKEWQKVDAMLSKMTDILHELHIIKIRKELSQKMKFKWKKENDVNLSHKHISQIIEKNIDKIHNSFNQCHLGFYWHV